MSLIINGIEMPTNGTVMYNGTDITKVVCNGVTVWEKVTTIDLIENHGGFWNDNRSLKNGGKYPNQSYYGTTGDTSHTIKFLSSHSAERSDPDWSYADEEEYDVVSHPIYAEFTTSGNSENGVFHNYIWALVDLSGYSKISVSGRVKTSDQANDNNKDDYTGPYDEDGNPVDDIYDANAWIQIDVWKPTYSGSTITAVQRVGVARSDKFPGSNPTTFARSVTLDVSYLTGTFLVFLGAATSHSTLANWQGINYSECILNTAEITQ